MAKDLFLCHAEKGLKSLCSDAPIPAGMSLSQPKNKGLPGIFLVGIVHWDQCGLSHGYQAEEINPFTRAHGMIMLQGLLTHVHTEESEKATVHSQRLLLLLS